jgi:seryl-tRNA synthetase
MLDLKFIRQQPEIVRQAIADKRISLDLDALLALDIAHRKSTTELETLQKQRNENAKAVPSASPQDRPALIARGRELGGQIEALKAEQAKSEEGLRGLLLLVPQIPAPDAPRGASDQDNVEIKRWGQPALFAFEPRDHVALLKLNGWAELDRIGRIAGSRSYALRGLGALLELSLLRYGVDKLVGKGFIPMTVPSFAIEDAFIGSGHFPTGRSEAYYLADAEKFIAGTSEVTLNYLHSGEILDESDLPIRYAGISTCFRKEAGSAGRDVRGLVRVHQFQKVEQYVLCKNDADESARWHAQLLATAEEVLQELELPYRVVDCCTGDMGQGKVRMYDVETWVPSEQAYRETHSCSKLHDWQARRSQLRYRNARGEIEFCHTLNNTAVATPRLLVPLLENHQQADGSVQVPAVLRPYLGGRDRLYH